MASDASAPVTLLVGEPRHGVVQYARDLARAGELAVAAAPGARTHLHVTDRALASSPEAAAARVEALAATTALSVTLHDLPQASDGPRNLARRSDAYGRIAAVARGVAVSSAHEAALFAEHIGGTAHVIPLGARRAAAPATAVIPSARMQVLIAGYVYPGKGHAEALRAATGVPATVVALGAASAGHDGDVEALRALAEQLGVGFELTGYLDDDAYAARQRGAGIPLAAHRHLSASRSLLDWIEAGRRPIVVASRYTEETARLRPGTMTLCSIDGLAAALRIAWRDPASTVLAEGTPLGPTLVDAAAAYRRWWAELDG